MRILISGAGGLIGRAVTTEATRAGHSAIPLRRSAILTSSDSPMWEPLQRRSWDNDVGPVDAVVHLAGENLAARRWTPEVKRRLRDGRVIGTRQLTAHLAKLTHRPKVLIVASAVGYYGNRGDEILTEDATRGDGFLSDLCREWEAACDPARDVGIRVVNLRFGMVLDRDGGALASLLPLFRMGLGGRLGSGRQWMSWVARDDLVAVIMQALEDTKLAGPVNVVSPNPVTNREFTQALGGVLRRPAFLAVPAWALRVALGEMAGEMLLSSIRVVPKTLSEKGFRFKYPDLAPALRHIIFTDN